MVMVNSFQHLCFNQVLYIILFLKNCYKLFILCANVPFSDNFKWVSSAVKIDDVYSTWHEGEPNNAPRGPDGKENCAEFR